MFVLAFSIGTWYNFKNILNVFVLKGKLNKTDLGRSTICIN